MSNPNLYKDEMDRVYKVEGGSGGGGKFYTSRMGDDEGFIIGAGKDIESIMANGGFTLLTPEDNYNQYERQNFCFNAVRRDGGEIVYYFQGHNNPEPVAFEIVGDDLRVGLQPLE